MWRIIALATSVFERCGGSSGTVDDIFHRARTDLGQLAKKVRLGPQAPARTVLDALHDNRNSKNNGLIGIVAPALGNHKLPALA